MACYGGKCGSTGRPPQGPRPCPGALPCLISLHSSYCLCLPPAPGPLPEHGSRKLAPEGRLMWPRAGPPQGSAWPCPRENRIGTGVPLCRMGALWVGDFAEKRGVALRDSCSRNTSFPGLPRLQMRAPTGTRPSCQSLIVALVLASCMKVV